MKLIVMHPVLLFWSIIPTGVTFVFYLLLVLQLKGLLQSWLTNQLSAWGWNPQGWFAVLASILIQLILVLAGAFTFSFTASIVAAPFNDFLAESAEPRVSPPLPASPRFSWPKKLQLIGVDVLKSLLAAGVTLIALFLSWIPVLNLFTLAIMVLLVTFQFISYPQTRRSQGVGEALRFIRRHVFASFGFGLCTAALFAVPLVSFLFLPAAVVGGTLLYSRAQDRHGLPPLM